MPGAKKAKRLTGDLYSEKADYASLLEQSKQARTPMHLTSEQYQHERSRLDMFVSERKAFNIKAYLTPRPMRHRKNKIVVPHTTTKREKTMDQKLTPQKTAMHNIKTIRATATSQSSSDTMKNSSTKPDAQNKSAPTQAMNDSATLTSDASMADSAFDSVISATQAVAAAETSLAGAIAQLTNARAPEQQAKATRAVHDAKAKLNKALAMLAMAKIRSLNTTNKLTRKFR